MSADSAQIILAAATAALPKDDGYEDRLRTNIAEFAAMANDESYTKIVQQIADSKVFTGIVLGIQKENSSTRGIVTLKTKVSNFHPNGQETVRTERTDSSPATLALCKHIKDNLIGHKVAVWVEIETYNEGAGKVRVLRHIKDLGPASEEELAAA